MKHLATMIVILAQLAPVAMCAEGIQWHASFEEAQEAAKHSQKPIMAVFWRGTCPACGALDDEALSHPGVIAKAAEFEPVKVNTEDRYDLGARYMVAYLPTTLFLAPGGETVYDVVGAPPPEIFLARVDLALAAYEAFKLTLELEPKFAENPEDGKLALQLAEAYWTCRHLERAADYASKAVGLAGDDLAVRAKGLLMQGKALAELGEPRQAIGALSTFLAENPESEAAWEAKFYLGFAHLQAREDEQGVAALKDVAENAPANSEARAKAQRLLEWFESMLVGGP